jgi:hypothetical protein
MPKMIAHGRKALLSVIPPNFLVAVTLVLVATSQAAYAGNTSVLVVPQDGTLGVVEIPISEDTAKRIEADLARGALPIIQTEAGKIQIKGMTRSKELLGTGLKGEQLVLPQPD